MPFDFEQQPTGPTWPSHEEYCRTVDYITPVLRLDPNSDDIQKHKEAVLSLIADGDNRGPQFFLNMLAPFAYGRREGNGSITVLEGNMVLQPWTIADWHCPDFKGRTVRIVIGRDNTRLYATNDEHLLTFSTKIIPHRNIEGNIEGAKKHYEDAARLVMGVTGYHFDWSDLAAYVDTVTVTREHTPTWQTQFSGRKLMVVRDHSE
jgi:hypothetical protein